LLAAGCTKPNPTYCDDERPCDDGVCDLSTNTCVEVIDAAPTPDARLPVVMTNQAADLVLGQSSFETDTDHGCTAQSAAALAVAGANSVLYVRDSRLRILTWTPIPTISNASPSYVLGQDSFTECTSGAADAIRVGGTGGISAASGKLAVADGSNNRVMIWRTLPTESAAPSTFMLGQSSSTSTASGNAANQMNRPLGVWTDGTRVAVAEQNGGRVLLWNEFPATPNAPADVVVGQTDFGITVTPTSPTASNLLARPA
jgi:hypothetical protein